MTDALFAVMHIVEERALNRLAQRGIVRDRPTLCTCAEMIGSAQALMPPSTEV